MLGDDTHHIASPGRSGEGAPEAPTTFESRTDLKPCCSTSSLEGNANALQLSAAILESRTDLKPPLDLDILDTQFDLL